MKKISIKLGIISLLIFSGCATNQVNKLSSGTYDADTFRAIYDPEPGVDYTKVLAKAKNREKSVLHLASGTYDADTFRAIYDPKPGVDYTKILAESKNWKSLSHSRHGSSHQSGNSSGSSQNQNIFWALTLASLISSDPVITQQLNIASTQFIGK